MTQKLTYSLAETAQILSIGKSHLKKFTDSGDLRSFKVGNRRLISREAIDEFRQMLEERGYTETPNGEES